MRCKIIGIGFAALLLSGCGLGNSNEQPKVANIQESSDVWTYSPSPSFTPSPSPSVSETPSLLPTPVFTPPAQGDPNPNNGAPAQPRPTTTTKAQPRPTTPKAPTTTKPRTTAPTNVYYKNCAAVKAAGKAPIRRGQPGYGPHLDRDGDGVGCER